VKTRSCAANRPEESLGNALSANKEKVSDVKLAIGADRLLNGRFLLLQKGKKDSCVVKAV